MRVEIEIEAVAVNGKRWVRDNTSKEGLVPPKLQINSSFHWSEDRVPVIDLVLPDGSSISVSAPELESAVKRASVSRP